MADHDVRRPWAAPDPRHAPSAAPPVPPPPQAGWSPHPPPYPTLPSGRPGRALPAPVVVALAVAATFVFGTVPAGVAAIRSRLERSRVEAVQRALDAELPALIGFVQRERGLLFERSPVARVLDDEDFFDAYAGDEGNGGDGGSGDRDDFASSLVAMHLVPANEDLAETGREVLESGLGGFYDSGSEVLYVRGSAVTPLLRSIVVHELTHALQDQQFDLDRDDLDGGDGDAWAAWQALVEGDATSVEDEYVASLPERVRDELEAEMEAAYGGVEDTLGSQVLGLLHSFPYALGPDLVRALRVEGGRERLDTAFRFPPTATEHVLHPETFLRGEWPVHVPLPEAAAGVVDQGTLGEFVLYLLVTNADPTIREPSRPMGWAGDRYVTWREPGRVCLRVHVEFDAPKWRDEMHEEMTKQDLGRGGSLAKAGPRGMLLTTCGHTG